MIGGGQPVPSPNGPCWALVGCQKIQIAKLLASMSPRWSSSAWGLTTASEIQPSHRTQIRLQSMCHSRAKMSLARASSLSVLDNHCLPSPPQHRSAFDPKKPSGKPDLPIISSDLHPLPTPMPKAFAQKPFKCCL
jgi:hypothetical protein